MPLYLPPHSPTFLFTSPHLPLPRHRAINLFIPAYERLWIEAEEYSFEEKLVQDLAVSTGLTLPVPRVPCVGTSLPVLSAECFFSSAPIDPWERARVGTSFRALGGPRSRRAKPLRQRSVRGQRLHDQLRRHRARASSSAHSSRKARYVFLTAVVRRAFHYNRRLLLAVWLSDLLQPISCLFAVFCDVTVRSVAISSVACSHSRVTTIVSRCAANSSKKLQCLFIRVQLSRIRLFTVFVFLRGSLFILFEKSVRLVWTCEDLCSWDSRCQSESLFIFRPLQLACVCCNMHAFENLFQHCSQSAL